MNKSACETYISYFFIMGENVRVGVTLNAGSYIYIYDAHIRLVSLESLEFRDIWLCFLAELDAGQAD